MSTKLKFTEMSSDNNAVLAMTEKVLLITDDSGDSHDLIEVMSELGYRDIRQLNRKSDIYYHARDYQPGMIVVDISIPDESLLESVSAVNKNRPVPIIMFVEESSEDVIADVVKSGVSAYVVDGFHRHRIRPIIDLAIARFQEGQRLKKELNEARCALGDRKDIDRAKGVVMKQKHCDEDTAYKLIRKMAMDKNVRIADIAKQILDISSLLQ
ncbi:ANTAR domain-containing response regulator [Sulfuriflexus mobilis]|uniref:ANTAR domain-containing response regulator n=1 Tax=Sulfuriflexus mobilis TaxID=1811807 RepID=UPI000F8425AF|nr:ANTAR domain-containing protein [Sulfuriflexus mobilis]